MIDNQDLPIAKFLRLKNGDDIISEVVEFEENGDITYQLINPLKVAYLPSQSTGYLQIAFMPWVFPRICSLQEFIVYPEDVLVISNVAEKMNDYYWDSIDTYINEPKAKVEETTVEEPQEEMENIAEILQSLGLDKKKVFH